MMGNTNKGESQRFFAVSDLHVDVKANWEYWLDYDFSQFNNTDVLIVAGDVGTKLQRIEEFLALMKKTFAYVFFVPGNHDLWCHGSEGDSIQKFQNILDVCDKLGVFTKPMLLPESKSWVVPLFGWHDCELDGHSTSDDKYEELQKQWNDYHLAKWPSHMNSTQTHANGICQYFLKINEDNIAEWKSANQGAEYSKVITFSHFLPREELMPIICLIPTLVKVAGCTGLESQLRAIGSTLHVYGHTHVDSDKTISGVRYVQNSFGMPKERTTMWKKMTSLKSPFGPYLVAQCPISDATFH